MVYRQWNLSIPAINGTNESILISAVSSVSRGCNCTQGVCDSEMCPAYQAILIQRVLITLYLHYHGYIGWAGIYALQLKHMGNSHSYSQSDSN